MKTNATSIRQLTHLLLTTTIVLLSYSAKSQCDDITPSFIVDLSANPYMTWTSPLVQRDGNCCGTTNPDKCLEFIITLHPEAASLVFTVSDGAVPPGALFYQIDCGPPIAVGSPICLHGTGPFHLTFCKPGNNENAFTIETIPNPIFGPDISLNNGCEGMLYGLFYDESSITWTSVSPGAPGAYNSYLDCVSGCDTVHPVGQPGAPAVVEYIVCGMAANGCTTEPICDTQRVTFIPPIVASINAPDTHLCYNETTVPATASATGGTPPYTYSWNTGETTPGINAGVGSHTVTVNDQSGCSAATATVVITQSPIPVVNAGAAINQCAGDPGAIAINGTASNTSAVVWSSVGGGTFGNATALSTTFTPTAAQVASGSFTLTLTSNDVSGCPPVSSSVTVNYQPVFQSAAVTPTPVSCFGESNGSVSVAVTGTGGPYTYAFDGAAAGGASTASGLTAGNHTVTITSALGCDTIIPFVINTPTQLLAAPLAPVNVSCNGGANGQASVAVSGGTSPYQYVWNTVPAQTASAATGLAAGTYTVSVTDQNGCPATASVTITQPTPVSVSLAAVPPGCNGLTNGSVTATPAGGTPGYNYSWSTGSTGSVLSNIGAGTYSVTMTDANGCPATASTAVSQPPVLVATASNDVTVCPGASTPVSVNAAGGTSPYSYAWAPGGQTGSSVNVTTMVDQQFSVTVTDANGCTATDQVMVTTYTLDPADFTVNVSDDDVCPGTTVTLTAAYAGTEAATISWAHCGGCPAVTTVTPAATMTYTATVTNLCGQTASVPVTVIVNTIPTVSIDAPDTQLCYNEATLAVTAVGAGGEAPYNYSWSNGATTALTNVGPGTHTVTISDVNNCGTAQASVVITQTVIPVVNANAVAPLCAGTAGAININGTASNTSAVVWSGGQGTFGNSTSLNTTYTPTAAETAVGTVVLTLTSNDISGCPPVFANTAITFQSVAQQIALTTQDVNCFGASNGSVTVNVSGTYGPYSYSYNGATAVASNTHGGLAAGTYSVTVYSAIGCDTTLTFTINTPAILAVSMPLQQGVSCFGGSDGQAMVGVTGGTAPYQYVWATTPVQNTATATGLSAGNYTVTVTDAQGCTAMTGAVISEPTQLAVTLSAVPPGCFGSSNGSVTANPTGGTPGYNYNWNNAATGTTLYDIGAGSYAVTVTDANGCIANANTAVGEPTIIVVTASNDVTVCPGTPTPLSVSATGGTGTYTYLWTPGGQTTAAVSMSTPVDQLYTVSVTDINGCVATEQVMVTTYTLDPADLTVSASATAICDGASVTLTAAYAGTESATIEWQHCPTCPAVTQDTPNGTTTYTATVTNLCAQSASASVTVTVNYPPIAAINAPDVILCHNEVSVPATAQGSGGTAPYSFSWSNGATTAATSLTVGTHTVSVTDVNNCGVTQATVMVTQLPAPQVQAGADVDLCAGFVGPVTVTGTASNTSAVYWTGGTGSFANPTALSTQYFPSDDEAAGGEVNLMIISNDSSGCPPASDAVQLEYNYVSDQVVITPVGVSCFGLTDGSVSIVMNGPNPPYTFAFDGGPQGSGTSAANLAAGTHTITIYNALGCDSTLQFQVPGPQPLVAGSAVLENVSCFGGADGSVIATAAGGTAPYQYSWSSTPAQQNAQASGIPAGNYTVTVTDNNGCSSTSSLTVTQPNPLTVSVSFVPPSCNGLSNGAATASVGGGAGGYGYFWNTGAQSISIYDIPAGNYTITAADANGCTVVGVVNVTEPPLLVAVASNDTTICPNSPASLAVAANGGTGTFSYQWTPGGQTTAAITVTPATNLLYTVVVTDNNGCAASDDVQVTTESMNPADISILSSGDAICAPAQVQLTVLYGGTDPSVQLSWQHCPTCPATITETPDQTMTYVAQATNYCSQVITDSITITVNFPPELALDSLLGELCPYERIQFVNNGENDPSWTYDWSFGDGGTSILPSPQHFYINHGTYNVSLTVTDENGCQSTLTNGGIVVVHPAATADFYSSSLTESLLEPQFDFYNTSSNATTSLWNMGDGTGSTAMNVSHTYEAPGDYVVQLVANNQYNCPDSTQIMIRVTPSFDIYVPNAFTPDGDSYNNTFAVKGYGLIEKDFSMEIYDRWGELIFHSTDINVGWDGTTKGGERASQDGVYTWVIYFRDLTDTPHRIEGHVTILR